MITPLPNEVDVLIVGAGAAGLFAGIWAGRTGHGRRILLLDGARTLGAKILVAGGGRCNVTHDQVTADAYAGGSRNAIRKVLRRFDVPETVAFFEDIGVDLKREDSGKLFPVTDSARTVLDALLDAVREAGAAIGYPYRVESLTPGAGGGFDVGGAWGQVAAGKVVLATGGMSLPKSGSDGGGYALARALGHSITPRVFPALVPLVLPGEHLLRTLSGIAADVTVEVWRGAERIAAIDGALLCTHFGLSGPAALDISRYYTDARLDDPQTRLIVRWLPDLNADMLTARLLKAGRSSVGRVLSDGLPGRLAAALCAIAGVDAAMAADQLTREARRALVEAVTAMEVTVAGDRGFTYAEVTAGGVPLSEIRLETMESRVAPGLHLCGEICDVDGRIGGYNFQWAWSSGYVAGVGV